MIRSPSQRPIWLVFTLGFLALVIGNKLGEGSCWFYSDERGEYSFSELLTNLLYLVTAILLAKAAVQQKRKLLFFPAALAFLLLMEEANYGQILWDSGGGNLFENEEQAALHTQLLRPVFVFGTMDGAELMSLAMLGSITVLVPLFLRFFTSCRLPVLLSVTPFLLACLCHAGKWRSLLVPWSCGYDSFEEIIETLMAASCLYWSLLYLGHLKARKGAPE